MATATRGGAGGDAGPGRARLRRKAHRVALALHAAYGSPRHGNKDDPLDELVFIVLSQMTTGPSFNRVFDRLKAEAKTWEAVLRMPPARLKAVIKDAGLSGQKSPRILSILRRVREDFGRVSLEPLRRLSDAEAEGYLTTLPGVGVKTAKCVLLYSLGRQVLPVDTHVWRISRRLGLVPDQLTYDRVHSALEQAVAPRDRYSLHVNGLSHGREVCRPLRPRCEGCPLRRSCDFYSTTGRGGAPTR